MSTASKKTAIPTFEEAAVLTAARESPDWSSRQLATWITDNLCLSVGESNSLRWS